MVGSLPTSSFTLRNAAGACGACGVCGVCGACGVCGVCVGLRCSSARLWVITMILRWVTPGRLPGTASVATSNRPRAGRPAISRDLTADPPARRMAGPIHQSADRATHCTPERNPPCGQRSQGIALRMQPTSGGRRHTSRTCPRGRRGACCRASHPGLHYRTGLAGCREGRGPWPPEVTAGQVIATIEASLPQAPPEDGEVTGRAR